MWTPEHDPVIWANVPWHVAINDPGAAQMGYVRKLFEQFDYQKLAPSRLLVVDGPAHGGAKIRALHAKDGSLAFVYSPRGEPFTVNMSLMQGEQTRASWYDPRTGERSVLYTGDSISFQTFKPPTSGRGNDWVLVLEGGVE